ncbi:MAG: hypothetical protein ACRDRL_24550, partial [Sciscionella sp.]
TVGPGDEAPTPGSAGTLHVGLGPHDARSIVGDAREHPFPVDELPPVAQGWWLTATAQGPGVPGGQVALPLFLPHAGAGWSCPCPPGSLHACDASQRRAWLVFPLQMPAHRADADVEVCVYLGRILIQALRVRLPVDGRPAAAAIAWSRGTALGDLYAAARRGASLYESDEHGRHRVLLGEADGRYIAFELGEAQAAQAARILRSTLQRAHLQRRDRLGFGRGEEWTSLYDGDLRKSDDAYAADLRALAVAGADAYRALLSQREHRDRLRTWLDGETARLGRPPTIQLARATNTRVALPWQLLYHEPLAGDPAALPLCPSALQFGPHRAPGTEIPPRCPHAAGHALYPGAVCPYGFWGLAYILEIPPWAGSRDLPRVTGRRPPADLVMAVNHTLKPDTRAAHQDALAAISGDRFALAADTERARTLLAAGADVMYFLAHGVRLSGPERTVPAVGLDLGDGVAITPADVASWGEFAMPTVREAHRPLVVLNGCHTGEVLDDTLSEFVTAFIGGADAAGVVATEIPLDAPVACAAAEQLIAALWRGQHVGQAVHALRWDLLARGNVMGFAYSPYCDADLTLPVPGGAGIPATREPTYEPRLEQEPQPW